MLKRDSLVLRRLSTGIRNTTMFAKLGIRIIDCLVAFRTCLNKFCATQGTVLIGFLDIAKEVALGADAVMFVLHVVFPCVR